MVRMLFSPHRQVSTPAALICKRGFTLIELLVVIAILATLVGLGAFAVGKTLRGADKTKRDAFAKTLTSAIMAYKNENGNYPIDYSGSAASYTVGTVSSNSPDRGNAEVILRLLGRETSGKRDSSMRAYLTDSSMLYVCKGGKRISKLDDVLAASSSISSGDMIGFPITMNKTGSSTYRGLSQAKAFAPIRITFDFDLDHYKVSVPNEGNFNQVIKLH